MRLDLVREGRRWPEPEYRFKHALIQETAYRTLVADDRRRLHRKAAAWLEQHHAGREDEVAGSARPPLARRRGRGQGHPLPDHGGRPGAPGLRARRGDRLLPRAAPAARSPRRGPGDRARALQAGARSARVAAVRGGERDVSARVRALDARRRRLGRRRPPSASRRASCPTTPTRARRSRGRTSSSACSCSIASWSSGPSARSCPSLAERWEISDDGLRYVFHLREGLTLVRRHPLTAHDVEFGIKRVLNPEAPGSSVAIYFVLERRSGVLPRRATRTPRDRRAGAGRPHGRVPARRARAVLHERDEPARRWTATPPRDRGARRRWTEPGKQVVCGRVPRRRARPRRLVLERRPTHAIRAGNVAAVEYRARPHRRGPRPVRTRRARHDRRPGTRRDSPT